MSPPDGGTPTPVGQPEITVYSSPFCGPCERLKTWLTDQGLRFTVRDVMMDEDAGELLESRDLRTTPVLQVDHHFIEGFDLSAIETVLAGSIDTSAEPS